MKKAHVVGAGLLVLLALTSAVQAAKITFVGDLDGDGIGDGAVPTNAAADASMINRLANVLGHIVTSIDDSAVTAATVANANFIVLSSTAASNTFAIDNSGDGNSGAVNSLATSATIVLMEGGNSVLSAFSVNGGGGGLGAKTGTNINILADDGYVTAGLPLGSVSIYNVASNIGTWGAVAPQGAGLGAPQFDYLGTALASVSDGAFPINDVVIGAHAVGDNTIVLLPFHNGAFTNVNANGLRLFDNVFGFVPEPASALLMMLGLLLAGMCRLRR